MQLNIYIYLGLPNDYYFSSFWKKHFFVDIAEAFA